MIALSVCAGLLVGASRNSCPKRLTDGLRRHEPSVDDRSTKTRVTNRTPLYTPQGEFRAVGDHLELNGKPFVIRSGEMHYPRVPRPYWRDRFRKAKAMGLNTICTYVFWNLHEPTPGHFDFRDNLDLATYLKTAKEEGLYVILRPGPYICTELDFGGLPSWLLKDHSMRVRSRDPKFLAAARRYLFVVGKIVKPYLFENGGPVIMTQVENEYGSYGSDHVYTGAIKEALRASGFGGQLFTSDGPGHDMLSGGTLPGIPAAVNFGGGGPAEIAELEKFRPGSPKMVGEYWCGWFDHWGERHHTTGVTGFVKDVNWFLENKVSFNLYMFHGGTSFAFMPGANGSATEYQPDVTSYDYDSPLDESGRTTPKYRAVRDAIAKATGETLPPIPETPPAIIVPAFRMYEDAPLLDRAKPPIRSDEPPTFEDVDQAHGYLLYQARTMLTGRKLLSFDALHDYALIYVNGKKAGILDRRQQEKSLTLDLGERGATIDIVVEANARINYGHELAYEREGIVGKVRLGDVELRGWSTYRFPILSAPTQNRRALKGGLHFGPEIYRGSFWLQETGDTFFDLGAWTKGYVWVNGHNLGRFWNAGPQRTLYVPGCWLKRGRNHVEMVDEGEKPAAPSLAGLDHMMLDTRPNYQLTPHRKPGQALRLDGLTPSAGGAFSGDNGWKIASFTPPIPSRYVCFEVLSEFGQGPFASGAELEVLDADGARIPGAKIAYADSEELTEENGSADNLLDQKPATIWHTEWGDAQPGPPHAVVIDLGAIRPVSGIRYLPRITGVNGRVKDYRVYVSTKPFPGL